MDQRGGSGGGSGRQPQKGPNPPIKLGSVSAIAGVGIIALIAVVLLTNSFVVIDTGTRGVLKTFGEVTGVFEEGLHFRVPFVTSVTMVDVKTQRYSSASSAASRDLQIVTTEVVLNYRPDPEGVGSLISEIGVDYENKVIDPAIQESVKAATAQFDAEELITQRPLVSTSIRDVLSERLTPRNITIEEVSITEFQFSEEFNRAIESKQVAQQNALRAEQELRRAQIDSQRQVAEAEAQAEARIAVAQAEAEALRLQREVISPELLQLRFIEKWNGVLPRFTSGGNGMGGAAGFTPLINLPADEVLADDEAEGETSTTPTSSTSSSTADTDDENEDEDTTPTPTPDRN
jgi:regulator of protease activity HflC (stomatin/prohibitin superfamily)